MLPSHPRGTAGSTVCQFRASLLDTRVERCQRETRTGHFPGIIHPSVAPFADVFASLFGFRPATRVVGGDHSGRLIPVGSCLPSALRIDVLGTLSSEETCLPRDNGRS